MKSYKFQISNLKIFRGLSIGRRRVGMKTKLSAVCRLPSIVCRLLSFVVYCLSSVVRRPLSVVLLLVAICGLWTVDNGHFVFAEDYIIGPDDVLNISVYREQELDRTVRVSSDGYFSFPLIGQVKACGMSMPMLEITMGQMLQKYLKNPQVTAFIQEYSTITVSGQVKKPGAYPLKGQLTVMEAISLAGGFTKIAARNNVKIMRVENGKKKAIRVRVADVGKKGDKLKDVALKRSDIVFIPESMF